MEGERKGQQLLEPLTDTEGCTVPFGEHSRSIDLRQLPSLPVSRHRAIAAGLDDPLDSDYGSAWDFTKLQATKPSKTRAAKELVIPIFLKPGDGVSKPRRRYVPLAPLPPGPSRSQSPDHEIIYDKLNKCVPLLDQEWYHGSITRDRAEIILSRHESFSFLVRTSESSQQGYVLSIKLNVSCTGHIMITEKDNGFVLGLFSPPFKTVPDCIDFYTRTKLNIRGMEHGKLEYPVKRQINTTAN